MPTPQNSAALFRATMTERLKTEGLDIVFGPAWSVAKIECSKPWAITVRLPQQIPLFDELWQHVERIAQELNVEARADRRRSVWKISRGAMWPTVEELRGVLGQVKWLWHRWIAAGFITLLVGEPGTGKSIIALDWVDRVISGRGWPLVASQSAHKGDVCALWIETESSQQLVVARTASMKIQADHIIVPGFGDDLLGQPDLMKDEDRARILRAIDETRPGIVVLDSIGGAHTGGENRIEEVRPMLDFLARTARDKGVPIVVVHHLRKRSPGEEIDISLDRIRGSSAFSAFARSVIAVDGNARPVLRVIKSNLAAKPEPLSIEFAYRGEDIASIQYSVWQPPTPKRTRKQTCAAWVLSQLNQPDAQDGLPLTDLMERASGHGFTRSLMYAARDELGDRLTVTGDGRHVIWQLTGACDDDTMSRLETLADNGEEE